MTILNKRFTACLVVSILFTLTACSDNNTNPIHISGSTTVAPFMKKAAAIFKQDTNTDITITAPGSMAGIESFIQGSCDIVMSSSGILPAQKILAKSKQIEIKSFLLGYDLIVPIVNKTNSISNISLTQLKHTYSGKITNWAELGGKDAPIEIINRNMSSGSYNVWNRIITPTNNIRGKTLASNSAVLAHIAENKNAIGYISSSFINPEITPLNLAEASPAKDKNWIENYPVKRPLFLYVDQNKFNETLRKFIIFIIMNDEVKKLFNASGFYSS